ncbi:MAG: DMT family transporter [Bacteroidaceae bacterium]|nr:DMT family transporter [Bacteroidaceae bacterium]
MWLSLAFLSAALLGCYDVFKKHSLRDNAVIPVLLLNTVFCSLFFLPFILGSSCGWISEGSQWFVPTGNIMMHGLILLKAVIVLSSWILGYIGIKHLPITIVGPINATRPVMVLIGAMFVFGERLNVWQWAGVLVALLSFYLLSRSGRREGINFAHNRWIYCVVFAAILGAVSGLFDKYLLSPLSQGGEGLDRMAVQGWYNLYQCGMMWMVFFSMWYPMRRRTTPFKWKHSIVLISVFLTMADFMYFYALSMPDALVSVVSMIRRGSVVVSFVFGAWLFREKNLRAKAFDLLLVLLSMVLLWWGTRS